MIHAGDGVEFGIEFPLGSGGQSRLAEEINIVGKWAPGLVVSDAIRMV